MDLENNLHKKIDQEQINLKNLKSQIQNTYVKYKYDNNTNNYDLGILSNYNFDTNNLNFHKFCTNDNDSYHLKGEINFSNLLYVKINKNDNKNIVNFINNLKKNKNASNIFKKDTELNHDDYFYKEKKFVNNIKLNKDEEAWGLEDEEVHSKDFDQLKFNENEFKFNSNYSDSFYNSTIDLNNFNNNSLNEIEKIKKQIEKDSKFSNNRHYWEEKNLIQYGKEEMNENEEHLYSKVLIQKQVKDSKTSNLKDRLKDKLMLKKQKEEEENKKKFNRQNILKMKSMLGKNKEFTPNN